MATAAEAATAAAEAPVTTEEHAAATETELPANSTDNAEGASTAAPAAKKPSELVRLAKEKRALERKLADYEARAKAPAESKPALTREAVLAELKAKYEEDPDAFLGEVAGEDFVTLAQRLAKRAEVAKSPEKQIEDLQRQLKELREKQEGGEKAKAEANRKAITEQHISEVAQFIVNAKDDDGAPKYPTLASLDDSALEEPVAATVYHAVHRAFLKECCDKDGNTIPGRHWSQDTQRARFHAAMAAVDAHYAKLRTPKNPSTPRNPEPDSESRTISNNNSSGVADPPARRVPGTLTREEALRQALKEHGYS